MFSLFWIICIIVRKYRSRHVYGLNYFRNDHEVLNFFIVININFISFDLIQRILPHKKPLLSINILWFLTSFSRLEAIGIR